MKQFSLAGIPLRTIIKSSQSGIAISNHKRDPRRAEQELGPGWGWADVRNAGAHALGGTKPPGTSTLRALGSMAGDREVGWGLWRPGEHR